MANVLEFWDWFAAADTFSSRPSFPDPIFFHFVQENVFSIHTNLFSTKIHLSFGVHKQAAFWPILPVLPGAAVVRIGEKLEREAVLRLLLLSDARL